MTLYCLPHGHGYGHRDGDRFKTYFTQKMTLYCLTHEYGYGLRHGLNWYYIKDISSLKRYQ